MARFVLFAVCVVSCGTSFALLPLSALRGTLPAGGLTPLISLGTIIAVLPQSYRLTGEKNLLREVPLLRAGFSSTTVARYVPGSLWLFSACLTGLALGEAWYVLHHKKRSDGGAAASDADAVKQLNRHVRAFIYLALPFGLACVVVVRHGHVLNLNVIANRGSDVAHGQGIPRVGTWLVPASGLLLLTARSAFRPLTRWSFVTVCVLVTLASGTRTPLIFFAAYAASVALVRLGRRRTQIRMVIASAVGLYCLIVLVSGVNIWRGTIIHRTHDASLPASLVAAAQNPIAALPTAGAVNTLDGSIFVRILYDQEHVRASPKNWLVAGGLFVPSQLWSHKPQPLSAELSGRYLRFGVSGMFLSGPGYTWLTGYGTTGSFAIWLLLGFLVAAACGRLQRTDPFASLWRAFVLFFLVELWFAGDTFVTYYVGSIAIVVWGFYRMASVVAARTDSGEDNDRRLHPVKAGHAKTT